MGVKLGGQVCEFKDVVVKVDSTTQTRWAPCPVGGRWVMSVVDGGSAPAPQKVGSNPAGVAPAPEAEKGGKGDRLVLLNAFPISMLPWEEYPGERRWINVYLVEITPDELKWAVDDAVKSGTPILCYIRHPSTVRVLSEFLGVSLQPSAGLYKWRKGDRVYIVALKRPVRGADVEVSMDDLRIISCGIDVRW